MIVSRPVARRRVAQCLFAHVRAFLAGLACFGMFLPTAHAVAQTTPQETAPEQEATAQKEPYQLVRTLQAIQDRTAHGSREALTAQSPLLAQIERQLMAAPNETWQEPRNARAALSFALSGGSPAILRKLARLEPPPAIAPELLKGVHAYVEGDEDEAIRELEKIDPRTLAPGLNGRIALIQSALYARRDGAKAMAYLDLSRLLLPGTLVDEGALRRQVFLAGQLGLDERFKTLSKHYLQRYPQSVYAGDFHHRFSTVLVRFNMSGTSEDEKWLTDLLAALDMPAQINISLILAKQAISNGKTRMAVLVARRLMEIAPPDTSAHERAKLYNAAAIIINESDFLAGKQALQTIRRQLLPADDIGLLDSATYLATRIRELPRMPGAIPAPVQQANAASAAAPPAPPAGRGGSVETEPAFNATVDRIRQLIGDSDRLINEESGS
ncbi:MAG: chemotaxis protein MotC [Pseudochelatococcus sp.]|jgi:chemotaxis protein MotC|uniref:chemotaxis protein MotC n=1 Tax=Pseudochelatococcus sp. TaxID=2020869 RepID=UPI003D8FD22F